MGGMKFGFVMDPPETIRCLEDTSFYIMKESFERGHEVFYVDSRHVTARGCGLYADARQVEVNVSDGFRELKSFRGLDLSSLDIIFLRKDPPFDRHYLSLTYLLEFLKGKVPVLNDPAGVRNANEKLYGLRFPDCVPKTVVSAQPPVILEFLEEVGEAVLKPLWQRGGIGVVKMKSGDSENEANIRKNLREYGTLLAQQFIPEVRTEGDKRILVLNGEILGAYRRIPPAGDFRVSLEKDGKYEAAVIDQRDRELTETIRPSLLSDGLYFVGLDVIAGRITEINVTSPAGIPEINHFLGAKLEAKVVSFLERFAKRQ